MLQVDLSVWTQGGHVMTSEASHLLVELLMVRLQWWSSGEQVYAQYWIEELKSPQFIEVGWNSDTMWPCWIQHVPTHRNLYFHPSSSTFSILTAPFACSSLVCECIHPPSSVFAVLTPTPLSLLVSSLCVFSSIFVNIHRTHPNCLQQPPAWGVGFVASLALFQASFIEVSPRAAQPLSFPSPPNNFVLAPLAAHTTRQRPSPTPSTPKQGLSETYCPLLNTHCHHPLTRIQSSTT